MFSTINISFKVTKGAPNIIAALDDDIVNLILIIIFLFLVGPRQS